MIINQLTPLQMVIAFVLAVVGAGAVLYSLTRLYRFLLLKNGYAGEDEIEVVLMPVLYKTIYGIFEFETHALTLFQRALKTTDKKEMARITYNLVKELTVKVPGLPISVVVGNLVTEKQWAVFVQSAFDKLYAWYASAKDGLLDEFRKELPDLMMAQEAIAEGHTAPRFGPRRTM